MPRGERKGLRRLSGWKSVELSEASAAEPVASGVDKQNFSPELSFVSLPALPKPVQRNAVHQWILGLRGCSQSLHAGNCQCSYRNWPCCPCCLRAPESPPQLLVRNSLPIPKYLRDVSSDPSKNGCSFMESQFQNSATCTKSASALSTVCVSCIYSWAYSEIK